MLSSGFGDVCPRPQRDAVFTMAPSCSMAVRSAVVPWPALIFSSAFSSSVLPGATGHAEAAGLVGEELHVILHDGQQVAVRTETMNAPPVPRSS